MAAKACVSLLLASCAAAAPGLRRQTPNSGGSGVELLPVNAADAPPATGAVPLIGTPDTAAPATTAAPAPDTGATASPAPDATTLGSPDAAAPPAVAPPSAAAPPAAQGCGVASVTTSGNLIGTPGPGLLAGGPGAIFWQANDGANNMVFSANLDAGGRMTFGGAYSTNGRGAHIGPDTGAPNSVASQGSVKVVDDKLAVVNPGSNTVALFQIDFENPALIRMIGEPVYTGGTFPVSSTINQINHNVCVLNAGDDNGVQCYSIDLRRGLVVIPNTLRKLNLTLSDPPSSQDGAPNEVFFQPDGTKLFVTVRASASAQGFLATYDVDPADFSLSAQPAITPVPSGSSITPVANASAVFTNDIGTGYTVFAVGNGTAAASPPVAQGEVAIPGAKHNAWSEDSSVTGNYYIADQLADMLTEISIDPTTLASQVVKQYPLPTGGNCMDQEIATINGNDTLYIMCAGTLRMETFSLPGPGNVVPLQSFDLAAAAQQAGVSISSANAAGSNAFFTG